MSKDVTEMIQVLASCALLAFVIWLQWRER